MQLDYLLLLIAGMLLIITNVVDSQSAGTRRGHRSQNINSITTSNSPPLQPDSEKDACQILGLSNAQRIQNKKPALIGNRQLDLTAKIQFDLMVKTGQFSHSPGGSQLADRARQAGFQMRRISENLYVDVNNPGKSTQRAMDGWMKSRGHRENLLSDAKFSGTAYCFNSDGTKQFWVQVRTECV